MYWNLKRALTEKGYTQKRAAAEIGIAEKTLSNKMQGRGDFTLPEMRALQKLAGGKPLDELFSEK